MKNNYYTPRSIRKSEKKRKKNIFFRLILASILIYFLFSWGLPTLINGLSVFNKLKPSGSIEPPKQDNSVLAPPVLNIPFDATSSANLKITGYSSPKTKVEIYLEDQLKITTQTKDDGSFEAEDIELALGNNNISGITVDSNNNKSLPSKTIRVVYNNQKPKLEITSPQDGVNLKGGDKKLAVSGKTDINNSVTINGLTAIVDGNGDFSVNIDLNDGKNNIVIIATNSVGNTTKIERNVTFISPTPTPSPAPSPTPTSSPSS